MGVPVQTVHLVAGGGRSVADSGTATDLRLPALLSAMTTDGVGTLWLAGTDPAKQSPQIVSIAADGSARRIRLVAGSPVPTC